MILARASRADVLVVRQLSRPIVFVLVPLLDPSPHRINPYHAPRTSRRPQAVSPGAPNDPIFLGYALGVQWAISCNAGSYVGKSVSNCVSFVVTDT